MAPDGCPVTEQVAERLVRLPLYAGMTDAELDHVIASVLGYTATSANSTFSLSTRR
jgi:dTDP-4-amino-4,6-dideoxygalactose transaminase